MLYSGFDCLALTQPCRSGEIGRRAGLKIPWGLPPVWVRFPPPAPLDSVAPLLRSWQAIRRRSTLGEATVLTGSTEPRMNAFMSSSRLTEFTFRYPDRFLPPACTGGYAVEHQFEHADFPRRECRFIS